MGEDARVGFPLQGPGDEQFGGLLLVGVPTARRRQEVTVQDVEDESAVLGIRAVAVCRESRPGLLAAALVEDPQGGRPVHMLPVTPCHGPGHQLVDRRQDTEGPFQNGEDRTVPVADREAVERDLRGASVLVVPHPRAVYGAEPTCSTAEFVLRAPLVPVPGQGEQMRPLLLRKAEPGLSAQYGFHHRRRAAVDRSPQRGRSVRQSSVRISAALDERLRHVRVVGGDRQAQHRQAVVRDRVRVCPGLQQREHGVRVSPPYRPYEWSAAHGPPRPRLPNRLPMRPPLGAD